MSKYVIAWPKDHRIIKWLYYAEIRHEEFGLVYGGAYASPNGTAIIMRSALLSEAYKFDSRKEANEFLTTRIGIDNMAQIRKLTDQDLEEAQKERFNILLGNIGGTDS